MWVLRGAEVTIRRTLSLMSFSACVLFEQAACLLVTSLVALSR